MKPEISIIDSVSEHVSLLSEDLRQDDAREISCLGMSPFKGLWRSYKASFLRKTAFVDGKIAAMWGLSGSFVGSVANPWLLTGKVVDTCPLDFVMVYRNELNKMLEMFPVLENNVDSEYSKSIRLLGLMGFKIGDPVPMGTNGHKFCPVRIERGD